MGPLICRATGKEIFSQRTEASEVKSELRDSRLDASAYKCKFCKGWHWGHIPKRPKSNRDDWKIIKSQFKPGMVIEIDEDGEINGDA